MCLFPCWPCNDIFLEEEPKKKQDPGVLVYDPNAKTVVKVTGKVPTINAPMVYPQPITPTGYPYQTYPSQLYANGPNYYVQGQPSASGLPSFSMTQPAFSTIGQTGYEVLNAQMVTAQGLEMNKKQEMKPADDDPKRVYWCREPDGTWTQRNRLTIDSGDIGDCRWYAHEGVFYAVRLPS